MRTIDGPRVPAPAAEPDARHRRDTPAPSRRVGYVAAAIVNAVTLWVVAHLLEWGWPPFLTDGLDELMPLITVSLWMTVAANLVWAWRDPDPVKRLMQLVLNAVSFAVVLRTWQVFPFEFSSHATLWETSARLLLGLAFVGIIADTITQLVALLRPTAEGEACVPTTHGRAPGGTDG